jgi:hypothetical protein
VRHFAPLYSVPAVLRHVLIRAQEVKHESACLTASRDERDIVGRGIVVAIGEGSLEASPCFILDRSDFIGEPLF